jgi:hypothetical protein
MIVNIYSERVWKEAYTRRGYEVPRMILLQVYLYTHSLLKAVTFKVLPLSSCALSPMMLPATVGNVFGTPAVVTFFGCLQYPEIFVPLRQTLFMKTAKVIRSQIRETGWVFSYSNRFLAQKLLGRERLLSWSIVIAENNIVGPKFRPFSTRSFMQLLQYFHIISLGDCLAL